MKKIILGISSSIAAYKACDLTRLFVKGGYSVHVVITENALHLVAPLTLEILSGNPVYSESFVRGNRMMGHITLKDDASLMVVAPATANIIGKFANGIADDALTTIAITHVGKVLLAPAMNPRMWAAPAVKENVARLKKRGVEFVGPASGRLACGPDGEGRMVEVQEILDRVIKLLK